MQDDVAQPFKRSLTPGVGDWGYHVSGLVRLADGRRAGQVLSLYRVMDPPGFEPGSGDRMRGLALPIELQIHAPRKWGFGGSNYFLPQFKIWAGITRERIPLPAFLHRYTAYAVPRIYLRISIRRFPVMLYIIFAKPTASGLQCLAVF